MRYLFGALAIIVGFVAGALFTTLVDINYAVTKPAAARVELSYAELAAINMTAATVALGAVALVVAIAAVFGFQVIRAASVRAAEIRVVGELPRLLQLELSKMETDGRLSRALERAIYSGVNSPDAEFDDRAS